MSKGKKIAIGIVSVLVGLLALVVVGANVFVRVAYSDFYSQAQREFEIPGIDSGFICQDLDYYDPQDCWLFSGYSTSGGSSPLYRVEADGTATRFFATMPDGSAYVDHGSAITSTDEFAYLACDAGYLVFAAQDVAQAEEDSSVQAIDLVELEITPAFMNIENGTLYAGTFHLVPDYPAVDAHHIAAKDGTENAGVVLAYPASDDAAYGFSTQALCVYSIPDAAQGICVLEDGSIVLSSSYGLSSSHIRTYAPGEPSQTQTFFVDGENVPLVILDSTDLVEDVVAPPMTEGIENHRGRIFIAEESASNKYVFGKLYGAGSVYSIPACE